MAMMKRVYMELMELDGYDINRSKDFVISTHVMKDDFEKRGYKLIGEIQDYNRDNSDTMFVWEMAPLAPPTKVTKTVKKSKAVSVVVDTVKAAKAKLTKKPKAKKAAKAKR